MKGLVKIARVKTKKEMELQGEGWKDLGATWVSPDMDNLFGKIVIASKSIYRSMLRNYNVPDFHSRGRAFWNLSPNMFHEGKNLLAVIRLRRKYGSIQDGRGVYKRLRK